MSEPAAVPPQGVRPPRGAPRSAGGRTPVLLVHGLWMPPLAMRPLGGALRRAGFDVHLFGYASWRGGLDDNAARLAERISAIDTPTLHLLGHSLGGVLIAQALSHFGDHHAGRALMLGPPYNDSIAARRLLANAAGRWMIGRSVADWLARPHPPWAQARPLGVIAGTRAFGLAALLAGRLQGPSDGAVTVAETRVAGATAHATLPVSHSGMLLSPAVARLAVNFLQREDFDV